LNKMAWLEHVKREKETPIKQVTRELEEFK